VNSIDDSDDSAKVARIIKRTYRYLCATRAFPEHDRLGTLWPSTDDERPTHMEVPESVEEIYRIHYDIIESGATRRKYTEITYLDPDEFFQRVWMRDSTGSNIQTVLDYDQNRKILIQTDKRPEYWTSFDGFEHVVFDSFDSAVDDTIQASKIICTMRVEPDFTLSDLFIPDLHAKSFAMLEEESAKTAAIQITQAPDEESERRSRRLFTQNSWTKHKFNGGIKYPDFGK